MVPMFAGVWNVARVTYGVAARMPIYYILLALAAGVVLVSPLFTMFEFSDAQEIRMVREMGFATVTLWGFLVCLISAPLLVTQELEDRTALMIFAKPFSRTTYLVGKFLGLGSACAAGAIFLGLMLLLTLWLWDALPALDGAPLQYWLYPPVLEQPDGSVIDLSTRTVGAFVNKTFLFDDVPFVAGATALCVLEVFVIAAIAVALAALTPALVAAGGLTVVYILGYMLDYLTGALSGGGGRVAAEVLSTLLPNFGYLTLSGRFSLGDPVSWKYVCVALVYALLYIAFSLGGAAALFHRREIR